MSQNPTPQEPFMALIHAMADEIRLTTALTGLEPQFHRRLLVRVIFSTLEGYGYHLRRRALDVGNSLKVTFSKTETERLTEQKERKRPDGTVEMQSFFLKSKEGLTFSIRIFAKVMGTKEPAAVSDSDLDVGFAIRDRLTHPKTASAFHITEAEGHSLGRLSTWFGSVAQWYSDAEVAYIKRLQSTLSASIEAQIQDMKSKVAELK